MTTTGPDGTAAVTTGGTAENVVLNFTIPRGPTGADAEFTPAASVADVDESPTVTAQTVATTLNQLLASLRTANILQNP